MTRLETANLLGVLAAFYPHWDLTEATIEAWHEMLCDLPYQVARAALKRVLARSPRFPAVADIRQEAAAIMRPDLVSPEEAWALVAAAVDQYGYYRECEALEVLPELVRRAARAIGWEQICLDQPGVVRAQFVRIYEGLARREQEATVIPPALRALVAGTGKRLPSGEGEQGARGEPA